MEKQDAFSGFHPVVNFIYFLLVLFFTVCFWHPVCIAISFSSALFYALYLKGKKTLRSAMAYMLPMMLAAALLNPAFNHKGITILAYFPSGNPLTEESVLYGLAAATLLAAVLLWFICYNAVMTSDKFIYIFGRLIPVLSLVISMALRFIPKFKERLVIIRQSQQGMGRDLRQGSWLRRAQNGVKIFSILLTWSMESAIETADSMKSRGYGLPGRTAFSIYIWEKRDSMAIAWLLFCGFYIGCGWLADGLVWRYFPSFHSVSSGSVSWSFQLIYLALCLTPVLLNKWEDYKWDKFQKNSLLPQKRQDEKGEPENGK